MAKDIRFESVTLMTMVLHKNMLMSGNSDEIMDITVYAYEVIEK